MQNSNQAKGFIHRFARCEIFPILGQTCFKVVKKLTKRSKKMSQSGRKPTQSKQLLTWNWHKIGQKLSQNWSKTEAKLVQNWVKLVKNWIKIGQN